MPRTPKFRGPLTSPLAIRFDGSDTNQAQSPLLNLTPEIRNIIYDMVLTPENPIAVSASSRHNRSTQYTIKRNLSLTLLRTCRKVYLEAHLYPLQTNIHYDIVFPCGRSSITCERFPFRQLVQWQKSTITEIYLTVELCYQCFRQGPYLKVILSRTGMSQNLRTLHLHWVTKRHGRGGCPRAAYWASRTTRDSVWDLANFVQLKEITIQLEIPTMIWGTQLNTQVVDLAKTWTFKVGGNRLLKVEEAEPECMEFTLHPDSTTRTLRWAEQEN